MLLYRNIRNRRELVLICFCLNNMIRFKCRLIFIQCIVKNKKILILLPLLVILTVAFSFLFSNKVKTEVKSQEEMYYNITHNPAFPRVDGGIYDMALSTDGSILYVAGDFTMIGDLGGTGQVEERHSLAAINTSNYTITEWNPGANDMAGGTEMVFTIEVYGDSIYVGGSFSHIGVTPTGEFARINTDGTLDSSCLPNIYTDSGYPSTVHDVEVNSQYIYVGGSFNRIIDSSNTVYGLVRLNRSDCSWDSGFVPVLDGTVYDIELYDGGIYIGGGFKNIGVTYTGNFAKLNFDGSADIASCNPNIHTSEGNPFPVHEITLTDSYIYVGGSFNKVIDNSSANDVDGLIRIQRDGDNSCVIDPSWKPYLSYSSGSNVNSITPIGEDLLVGGLFDRDDSAEGKSVAIIDGITGDVLPPWNPQISWTSVPENDVVINSTLVHANKIYIGGNFDTVAGETPVVGSYSFAQFSYAFEQIPTIEIYTIEDLMSMNSNLIANFTLMNDLDFDDCSSYEDCDNKKSNTAEQGWQPIGFIDNVDYTSHPFYGVFDGQGFEISNLYINRDGASGLFGLNSGTIKNLKVVGADVQLTPEAQEITPVGVIAAYNQGTIRGCYASGLVSGNEDVGGLVGLQIEGTISNSSSSVNVSGTVNVGGLVGENYGQILNSYSTGSVTANSYAGGLVGYNNRGDAEGVQNIINSYSTGLVTGVSSTGGLVGVDYTDNGNKSFWDTQTSQMDISAGGLGKTTSQMKTLSTFSGWDIVSMNSFDPSDPNIWYLAEGQDYPRLFWEYSAPEVVTKAATNILGYSATLNGELVSMNGEPDVTVSFQYKKVGEEWISVDGVSKTSLGVYSSSITGLTLNTQYQFRTVVTWGGVGTVYGNILSFTTPENPTMPKTFGDVVSNIENIQTPNNTEAPLVLTKIGTGSITFPSGLDLVTNYNQLSTLSENLVIVYEPSPKRFRAYVNSNGASFLATHGATIKFFNVKNQLGIKGLTSSNFKTLLKVNVLDDSKNVVGDTSSYYDWNSASYNQDTDILTMPVNHFSEYVLGANTGVLPTTGMSSLTMLIPFGLMMIGAGVVIVSKRKYKKI